MKIRNLAVILAAYGAIGMAQAQTIPGLGGGNSSGSLSGLGGKLPGGASGLMGQGLPNVASSGTANTAGVLSYCVKNNYLQGGSASSVLSKLGGGNVQSSSAYSAGQQGQLETGNGSTFSMDSLKGQAKSKVCDLVLQHAQSML